VFDFTWYYAGLAIAAVGLIGWFWPRRDPEEAEQ
jgi:hypothetical protein